MNSDYGKILTLSLHGKKLHELISPGVLFQEGRRINLSPN